MAVTKCPICNEFLVGYAWTKTAKGKNWLSHPQKGWHDCPNKKLVKKTASKSRKITGFTLQPDSWNSEESGYYCRNGHVLGSFEDKEHHCPVCSTTTTCTWFHPGGPHP